jgi:hypothetical protein
MYWVLVAVAALLAVVIGSKAKYSGLAAGFVVAFMLAATLYFVAGVYFGWIEVMPVQH